MYDIINSAQSAHGNKLQFSRVFEKLGISFIRKYTKDCITWVNDIREKVLYWPFAIMHLMQQVLYLSFRHFTILKTLTNHEAWIFDDVNVIRNQAITYVPMFIPLNYSHFYFISKINKEEYCTIIGKRMLKVYSCLMQEMQMVLVFIIIKQH